MSKKIIAANVLFVEDGSIDLDEMANNFPETPIIVYRQGSIRPEFKTMDIPVTYIKDNDTFDPDQIRSAIQQAYTEIRDKFANTYILDTATNQVFADKVIDILQGVDPSDNE